MSVLIDSSVWIDYFRGRGQLDQVDYLIDENLLVTNDLILSELIPALHVRNRKQLITLLQTIKCIPLTIDWEDLRRIQIACLKNGVNGVGIPDIVIAQNAIQNNLQLLSYDKHFTPIAKLTGLSLY
jgi:hypothetical protein